MRYNGGVRGKGIAVATLAVGALLLLAPRASAGCHIFTATPEQPVDEGKKVKVHIERDNGFNPSSVRVRTVDGTAKAGADYEKFDQRVSFTNETRKTIEISTKQDDAIEDDETFTIELSEGQGCQVNPNFGYGPPAKVTITDDETPETTDIPTPSPTPTGSVSPTPGASASPSPAPTDADQSPEATSDPSPTQFASPIVEREDGGSPWPIVGAVLGGLAVGGGALILYRVRRGGL